jgi:hypothetical protein
MTLLNSCSKMCEWHHQIWGQYAGYAAGYAASSMLMPASILYTYLCYAYFTG